MAKPKKASRKSKSKVKVKVKKRAAPSTNDDVSDETAMHQESVCVSEAKKANLEHKEEIMEDRSDDDQFEDVFEDEFEDEDEFERPEDQNGGEEIDDDDEEMEREEVNELMSNLKLWRPGDVVEADEELVHDPTAYHMLHSMNMEYPCLSFDVIRDELGEKRKSFPHTTYLAAGTQSDQAADQNKILLLKLSSLSRIERDEFDGDEDKDDNDSETEDDPVLEHASILVPNVVNRVRCMPQQPSIVAAQFGSVPRVSIYECEPHLRLLDIEKHSSTLISQPSKRPKPISTFVGHRDEGYALDWSPLASGVLASGDCYRNIHVWTPHQGGSWVVSTEPYVGHKSSVEDIQWSPSQASVFASCSVDQTIKVWDSRSKREPQLSWIASDSDVNVISWNPMARFLLLSGSDDGALKVWDFRHCGEPIAYFNFHKEPITSVQWHPTRDSMFMSSCDDNRVTIWDLKMEESVDEIEGIEELPPQLLFEHGGVDCPKEVHWHPQIDDLAIITSLNGLSLFIPSNLDPIPDPDDSSEVHAVDEKEMST